jgi:hypothetical protein
MTGVEVIQKAGTGIPGKVVPVLGWTIQGVNAATLLVEAASVGVGEHTKQVETELLIIDREGQALKKLLEETQKYEPGSPEYKKARSIYFKRFRRRLIEHQQSLRADSHWKFLARAVTADSKIVMKELAVVGGGLATIFLGKKLSGYLKPRVKESVRWSLGRARAVNRNVTKAAWKRFDRTARRIGVAVQEVAEIYPKKLIKGAATSFLNGAVRVTQLDYGDCFDAIIRVSPFKPIKTPRLKKAPVVREAAKAVAISPRLLRARPAVQVITPVVAVRSRATQSRPARSRSGRSASSGSSVSQSAPSAPRRSSGISTSLGHAYGQAVRISISGWGSF